MPSLTMKRGSGMRQTFLNDGLCTASKDAGHICFSCEQIFANRKCLEEHTCSSVSFICSCGTEFTEYRDMLEHSTTHEPGHQVLDHQTIKKRRIERRKEEEEKLKRLQKGEVVWKAPNVGNIPSVSSLKQPALHVSNSSALMCQTHVQAAQIPQLPALNSPMLQASLLSNPASSVTDSPNTFAGLGAPTVDLWTLYQPVVLLKTIHKFNMRKPYTCGKCGQGFMSKASLMSHHSSHVIDKVSGCIGCGLLLSSKKFVPRFHACNTHNNHTKFRLITAKPLGYKPPSEAVKRQSPAILPPQGTSFSQFQKNIVIKGSQAFNSTQALKIQHIRTYNNHNRALHSAPLLQSKSQNVRASKLFSGVSSLTKSQHPTVLSRNGPYSYSAQLKTPTSTVATLLRKARDASEVFMCRVCHMPFETPHMLQRHKCAKAQEFMARHMVGGKQLKRLPPTVGPNSPCLNGERKLTFSPVNTKNQLMSVSLDKGKRGIPVSGEMRGDIDDDCYIVEDESENPAEMIYQVTSSVPIKT